jgi:hypothetical protein
VVTIKVTGMETGDAPVVLMVITVL